MPSIDEILASSPLAGLRRVSASGGDREVALVRLAESFTDLDRAPAESMVILSRFASAEVSDYRLDMALRWGAIHRVAAVAAFSDEPWQPTVVYPARGVGMLWSPEEAPSPPEALERLVGRTRATLLNAEENRKATVSALVSQVAADYFQLRELDYELEISQSTLDNRRESLQLVRQRQSGGVATLPDLRQAEQLVDSAAASIPPLQQQIEQTENHIALLLGENPEAITRGRSLIEQDVPPEVPSGMPSALLERRPDIRASEQALIAANANIGVAKAAYFPQISLSGTIGFAGHVPLPFNVANVLWSSWRDGLGNRVRWRLAGQRARVGAPRGGSGTGRRPSSTHHCRRRVPRHHWRRWARP